MKATVMNDQPVSFLLCALGGEGGGVLADWLVDVARHAGHPAQATSIPGVAQRTGATTYYLEVYPLPHSQLQGRLPVLGLNPLPGRLDALAQSIPADATTIALVTNPVIHGLMGERVKQVLRQTGCPVMTVMLPDGESHKSIETLNTIFDAMLGAKLDRKCVIVALGGGRTPLAPEFDGLDVSSPQMLARLRYAARIQRASGLPVLVTGGMPLSGQRPEAELMAESLREDFGVPVRWLEPASKTTAENAELTAAILQPLGVRQIVLVSHASHLPRAVKDFERAGFTVLPAPTEFTPAASNYRVIERWTPQSESLSNSRRALHEWLGLARDSLR